MNLDFTLNETQNYNSEYFEKTKASIIRNYFANVNVTNFNEANINIYFKDNFILKRLFFPKTIFRTYTIGLKDAGLQFHVPITHKEKDLLKDLIVQMNHNVYYNI